MSYSLGFIGCGNMAEALLAGIKRQTSGDVTAIRGCDIDAEREQRFRTLYGVEILSPDAMIAQTDCIVLAVKPQQSVAALQAVASAWRAGQPLISLVAGLSCDTMAGILGPVPIVRAMPNLPALRGQGISGLCAGDHTPPEIVARAEALFAAVGTTLRIEEAMMDALTAVAGSGPAYFFLIAEAMTEAAVSNGFEREQAHALVLQVMKGALAMLEAGDGTPARLREKVSSPGGTTLAALNILEQYDLRTAFIEACAAAAARSAAISAELAASVKELIK